MTNPITRDVQDPSAQQPSKLSVQGGDASPRERVFLRGVGFDVLTEVQTVGVILAELSAGRGGWLVTSNLDHLRRATRDPDFSAMLGEADRVVADGMPLVWASRWQGTPLPERVAGSALSVHLAEAAAGAGRSLFLLGGNAGVADAAAAELTRRFPGLRIAGTWFPPFGFENDAEHMAAMRAALDDSGADIVYVALGSPKQERLIRRLRAGEPSTGGAGDSTSGEPASGGFTSGSGEASSEDTGGKSSGGGGVLPGAWWVGVGISLSFIVGDVKRAPGWLQRTGFEWTHRLVQEPGRLFKRYLVQGVPFAISLLLCALMARWRGKQS